jgi:hypothetical protein
VPRSPETTNTSGSPLELCIPLVEFRRNTCFLPWTPSNVF